MKSQKCVLEEVAQGLIMLNNNWRVAGSNPTRSLTGLRDPTSLQGFQRPISQIVQCIE